MPINVPDGLPATDVLRNEGIFVMTQSRAIHQDIRPLRIAILNLMPLKIETEIQLLRLLSNTPIQLEIQLLKTKTYTPKNTPTDHLDVHPVSKEVNNSRNDYESLISPIAEE